MPDSGDKAKVEIEIAIRDMFSATMKEMGKELDNMNKKAAELGQGASSGFNKFRRENDQLNESTKRSNVSLTSMSNIVSGLTASFAGPVGLVAGFYSATQSLQTFAAGRVQLQMLSTDVGFSTQKISAMRQGLADMGKTTEEANQFIGTFGGLLKDVTERREGSALVDLFTQMGKPEMGAKILQNGRDFAKSADDILTWFRRQGPEVQSYFSRQTGLTESTLLNLKEYEAKAAALYESDFKHSQDYLRNMNRFQTELGNIWEKVKEAAVGAIDDNAFDKLNKQLKQEVDDVTAIYRFLTETLQIGKAPRNYFEEFTKKSPNDTVKDRFPEDKDWLKKSSNDVVKDRWGAMAPAQVELETDSNKSLRDIRDILLRMETGGGGGGSGDVSGVRGLGLGGGGGIGGGSSSAPSGQILQHPGGPALPESLGGPSPLAGTGGSGGITAPAGTPIHRGGMATVTAASGKTFQVDARFKDNFQGFLKDWEGAGGVLGPNSGSLGERAGNASGHPIGAAMDINQVGYGQRARNSINPPTEVEDALAKKWGLVSGNQWRRPDTGHFGVRSVQAAREALVKQGMMPSDADAAAQKIVKGSYFTDSQTASGISAATTPGIALPSREGLGKMYEVTGPDGRKMMLPQIDVGPHARTGRGIDLSGPAADAMGYGRKKFPTDSNFSYRQMDDARDRIDKTQNLSQRIDAEMNATVDFKNMPSWVKSSVDDNGAFKKLKVTRSTPQAGKAEAGNSADNFNSWSP